jgi:hypothetical protein
VFSDDYYLTDLDLWMIFEGSKIPVVVFYSTSCKTMVMNTNWIFFERRGDDRHHLRAHPFYQVAG